MEDEKYLNPSSLINKLLKNVLTFNSNIKNIRVIKIIEILLLEFELSKKLLIYSIKRN